MSRRIMDGDFRTWEVYVNTGPSGFSKPPRIAFRCVSDPRVHSRMGVFEGEPSEAARFVESGDSADLLALLDEGLVVS